MKHNFSVTSRIVRLSGAITAGTDGSRVTSLTEIDTQGYTNALVVAQLGTVTSGGVMRLWAKTSNTSGSYGSGTVGDIATVSATDWSNKHLVIDEGMLRQRYLRVDYQRTAANVAVEAIFVILYNAATAPTTDSNTTRSVGSGSTPSTT